MAPIDPAHESVAWDRLPILFDFAEPSTMVETYGFAGTQGRIHLEGQRLVPRDRPSRTVFLFMHPSSTLHLLPMPLALASAGLHVWCAASRYPKNDSALILEKVVYDLGAHIGAARDAGYEKVVLVGWSGGGSLSLFYQAEAESPSITRTPAGDPYDLTAAKLPLADGILFIAAHLSRAETLTEWIDPSILDELRPDDRDPELDIYAADARHRPPYSAAFVERFRAAQRARNRRISDWARELLETLRRRGDGENERGFVVHRTMCDVRWLDPAIEPNGRRPGRCYLGDPRTANVAPAGLARFSTLRSWLSQWSYELSNGKGPANAARIRQTPVLQVVNGADDAVPASHAPKIRAALATADKESIEIAGATHYYVGQPAELSQAIDAVLDWTRRHRLLAD